MSAQHETLPADIAAAIDLVVRTQHACARDPRKPVSNADVKRSIAAGAATTALTDTILRHLAGRAEAERDLAVIAGGAA